MWFRRPSSHPAPRAPKARRRAGFTLIEASLAIIIVGVGVLAAAELLATGTEANADSHRLTTGLNLAANVRELAQQKAADDILEMDGKSFKPAMDARGVAIPGLDDWEQVVEVTKVTPTMITLDAGVGSSSRLLRLRVTVVYRNEAITTEEWLLADTSD